MAQGKLKIKNKLPPNVKKNAKKGSAVTKRNNRPVKAKKKIEAQKVKQIVTKTLNKAVEEDIRAQVGSKPNLSKAQQAVAKYHAEK